MRQQTLTEFDPAYAELVHEVLPDKSQAVFFKDEWGRTYRGEFYEESGMEPPYFESNGELFDLWEISTWHPIRVDI